MLPSGPRTVPCREDRRCEDRRGQDDLVEIAVIGGMATGWSQPAVSAVVRRGLVGGGRSAGDSAATALRQGQAALRRHRSGAVTFRGRSGAAASTAFQRRVGVSVSVIASEGSTCGSAGAISSGCYRPGARAAPGRVRPLSSLVRGFRCRRFINGAFAVRFARCAHRLVRHEDETGVAEGHLVPWMERGRRGQARAEGAALRAFHEDAVGRAEVLHVPLAVGLAVQLRVVPRKSGRPPGNRRDRYRPGRIPDRSARPRAVRPAAGSSSAVTTP